MGVPRDWSTVIAGVKRASESFRQLVAEIFSLQSMSGKGNCWDNVVAESFFSSLKLALAHEEFETRREATLAALEYIEGFYNRQRIHSAVGYLSPAEYEEQFRGAA